MKEITGNIFDPNLGADAICVTTNGVVKANGELVMGAGIAKQFAIRLPMIASQLGTAVAKSGNHVHEGYRDSEVLVLSFPTKHHWRDPSSLALIKRSARELVAVAGMWELQKIVLPRPGCGLGGLKWSEVKAVIEPILDDRFYIITPETDRQRGSHYADDPRNIG